MNDTVTKHVAAPRQILILFLTSIIWYGIQAHYLADLHANLSLGVSPFEYLLLMVLPIALVYFGSAFATQEKEFRHRRPMIFWTTVAFASSPFLLGLFVMMLFLLIGMFRR